MTESVKTRCYPLPDGLTKRELYRLFVAMQTDLAAIQTQFNQLRTDFNNHVHGGVTAGAANTAAVTTTATALSNLTQP